MDSDNSVVLVRTCDTCGSQVFMEINAVDMPEWMRGDTDEFIALNRPKVKVCALCGSGHWTMEPPKLGD